MILSLKTFFPLAATLHNWRAWLIFMRPHTASLTWSVALLGYLAAGGELFSWGALAAFKLGLIWHITGFTHNNIADYKYDLTDPNKQHFPLVNGTIPYKYAKIFVAKAFIVLGIVIFWVAGTNIAALTVAAVGVASGVIYNLYGKRHYWKPIPIATCFASIPLLTYLSTGKEPGFLIWTITGVVFLQIVFQIAVSGELKEIEQASEKNILRALGAKVVGTEWRGYYFQGSIGVTSLGWITKASQLILAAQLLVKSEELLSWIAFILISAFILLFSAELTGSGKWDRGKRVKKMAMVELLSYWILVAALAQTIGVAEALLLFFAMPAWFMALNKVMWGTWVAPKV